MPARDGGMPHDQVAARRAADGENPGGYGKPGWIEQERAIEEEQVAHAGLIFYGCVVDVTRPEFFPK